MRIVVAVSLLLAAAVPVAWSLAAAEEDPEKGEKASPFAPSELQTASGELADPDWYYEPEVCGECHTAQYEAWKGSMHSRAHLDELYLAFANKAREVGGDELYRFCSACHAPGAVATGEIPTADEDDHTFLTNDGVSCDVCHQVSRVETRHAGGGANGSIVLEEGEVRFGPIQNPVETPAHESAYSETHTQSRLCSACHTLTHPHSGVVIENTYAEWANSAYAKAGIQCQDCHMRTVEQAIEVARTMKPLKVPGETVEGQTRENTYTHLFTGGNTNHELVGSSEKHAAEARARLRSAASMEVAAAWGDDGQAEITVSVTNVGAGHCIPTSITELRHAWIDLTVTDADGKAVYRSGALDENGKLDPKAVVYTAVLHDKDGKVTYWPWEAVKLASEYLIHPKETKHEKYRVDVPADAKAPLRLSAVLRYRSAPQDVLDELFGKGKLVVDVVDMTEAEADLAR
jgi:hypothetical protein